MANIDLTIGGTIGASEQSSRKHLLFANTVDISVVANNIITADVGQVLSIPANFFMTGAGIRLDTAGTATSTIVIGDGVDPNGWAAALFAADGAVDLYGASLPGDAYPALGGKYYATADTIDLTVATANLVLGVYTIFATGFMLKDSYAVGN